MNKRIIFMGTPEFAVRPLLALIDAGYDIRAVVTQPDRPVGRKRTLMSSPIKVAAIKHGIPVLQPEKLRQEAELVLKHEPDVIITAAYGQILPEIILNSPAHGCINIHASLLPKYRGGAPIHWALINGEKETGITIMTMVKQLDAGDILMQKSIPILVQDNVGTLHEKLSKLGAEMIVDILPLYLDNEFKPVSQDKQQVTYAYNIKREDELLDWSANALDIYNKVRGLHPWPVAFTYWQGQVFKIWWAEVGPRVMAAPGTIIAMDKTGIQVAAGEGSLILKEIQPFGKKRLTIGEFLNGHKISLGERLGEL